MSGRAKRGFWTKDGRWIQYWQTLSDSPEEEDERPDYTGEIILALAALTEKQRFVIERRHGLYDGPELTVCQVAAIMGISHVSVVRLEQRAMRNLRRGLQQIPMGACIDIPSANVERA